MSEDSKHTRRQFLKVGVLSLGANYLGIPPQSEESSSTVSASQIEQDLNPTDGFDTIKAMLREAGYIDGIKPYSTRFTEIVESLELAKNFLESDGPIYDIEGIERIIDTKNLDNYLPLLKKTVNDFSKLELRNNLYKRLPKRDVWLLGQMVDQVQIMAYNGFFEENLDEAASIAGCFNYDSQKSELIERLNRAKACLEERSKVEKKYIPTKMVQSTLTENLKAVDEFASLLNDLIDNYDKYYNSEDLGKDIIKKIREEGKLLFNKTRVNASPKFYDPSFYTPFI